MAAGNERLISVEKDVEHIDERLERLESKVDRIADAINALNARPSLSTLLQNKWVGVAVVFFIGNASGVGVEKLVELAKLVLGNP